MEFKFAAQDAILETLCVHKYKTKQKFEIKYNPR